MTDLLYPLASDLRVSLLLCFRCLPDFRTSALCFRAYAVVRHFGIRVILNLFAVTLEHISRGEARELF